MKGEYVIVENPSSKPLDISGWILSSKIGSQKFTFPEKTILDSGSNTVIWSGKNSEEKSLPPHSFAWTKRNIWNDEGDVAVLLKNDGTTEVSSLEVRPPKDLEPQVRLTIVI